MADGGAAAEVADFALLTQLPALAADATNRRALSDFHRLWIPDGVLAIHGMADAEGVDAVIARLGGLLGGLELLIQFVHGTSVVEVTAQRALLRTYISELARDLNGGGSYFAGIYQDRVVRTPDGWRFARRRFDFLYRGRHVVPGRAYPFPPLIEAE